MLLAHDTDIARELRSRGLRYDKCQNIIHVIKNIYNGLHIKDRGRSIMRPSLKIVTVNKPNEFEITVYCQILTCERSHELV